MSVTTAKPAAPTGIRPFTIETPEAELEALRARITATRWPQKETVAGPSQGVQLETIQALARYWAKDYDWRKVEARTNALPQFITRIDGLDITSFTCARNTRMRCRSSSRTDGPARWSSN